MNLRLRQARRANGLTQIRLAALAGTQSSYLSKIERGRAPLSAPMAAKLAVHLGVTAGHLLEPAPAEARLTGMDQDALRQWVECVALAIIRDSRRIAPPRPAETVARMIAYFAANPNREFELELYEERAVEPRPTPLRSISAGD